jgi:ABC-type sugar transport system permease subunit
MGISRRENRLLRFKDIEPYFYICPFFILYAIFGLFPFFSGIWISLHERSGPFGFANYIYIFKDRHFWKAISNAVFFALGGIAIILPIALIGALMLNSRIMGIKRGFVSTVFFVPSVTSSIVVGIVFRVILRTKAGVINILLALIHIPPIGFLTDPNWALLAMLIIATWRSFGINSLYFLSGIQAIPEELGEAARIDGASRWTEFWRIKFPLLRPILTFVVFQAILGAFAAFGDVITLGGTSARDAFLYPVIHLYNTMFKNSQINRAAAMGYIIAAVLFVLTTMQRKLFSGEDAGSLE